VMRVVTSSVALTDLLVSRTTGVVQVYLLDGSRPCRAHIGPHRNACCITHFFSQWRVSGLHGQSGSLKLPAAEQSDDSTSAPDCDGSCFQLDTLVQRACHLHPAVVGQP
jgi:hypothetical protein